MMNLFRSNILLSNILHNDLKYYNESGYGGKQIEKWPFYKFIKLWVSGNYKQARDLWIEWLVNEFNKYGNKAKSKGGMYQGSVHHYSLNYVNKNKNEHWIDALLINKINVKKGAALLVDKRIELIRSVINKGYSVELTDPIFAVRKGNRYVLKGGHHRAAIMHVIGHDSLPGVIIYSKTIWEFREWLVMIKKLLS